MQSVKCQHCGNWIGPMEVHEDCARKTEEARRKVAERWLAESPPPRIAEILSKLAGEGAN